MYPINLNQKKSKAALVEFSEGLMRLQVEVGFKVSARGWCYILEQRGYCNKGEFDKAEGWINECRKTGLLPVDFVAEEAAREFKGVVIPTVGGADTILRWMLRDVIDGAKYYEPAWWENEEYYIQVVVEKIDLVTLFEPVCKKYRIPIANAKGWSSILQRAEYARRFKSAEASGLKPVLLYCGDHDPDGLRISDTLRRNLEQISDIMWEDRTQGYDPSNLIIERFGLTRKQIDHNKYTWIDNLITGGNLDLSDPRHKNNNMPYVKDYIRAHGVRKCEANVFVTTPTVARGIMKDAIEKYLGKDATDRFKAVRERADKEYSELLEITNLKGAITNYLNP